MDMFGLWCPAGEGITKTYFGTVEISICVVIIYCDFVLWLSYVVVYALRLVYSNCTCAFEATFAFTS